MKLYQKIKRRQVKKYSPQIRKGGDYKCGGYERNIRRVVENRRRGLILRKNFEEGDDEEKDKRDSFNLLLENEDVPIDDVFTRKKKTEAKQIDHLAYHKQEANEFLIAGEGERSEKIVEQVFWQQKLKKISKRQQQQQRQQQSRQDRRKVRFSSLVAEEYSKRSMLVKMFATLVLLATLATCYGLTISDSSLTANHQEKKTSSTQSAISTGIRGDTLEGTPNETSSAGDESLVGATFRAPSFIKNVTAQNGQSVLLHCLVEPSSELAVSWFRGTGDLQLLTYGPSTIIQDERFVVRYGLLKEDDWALQIKNLEKNDAGLYQCQTNSDPVQSQYYQLNIVEPQVSILGAPDMAVKLGNAINLTCVISQSADQLQFVFWYRDNKMINYDMNERGKIVMSKGSSQKQFGQLHSQSHGDLITSNLQIFSSKLSDSGNYTCLPSGARPVSIYVHVLEGLDKRLIMFQNDYVDPTASSQQTNSAISVHITRLSQGRVYAFIMAALIFASWFQIVAQVQTFISIFLLAIIGFFLSKVTDHKTIRSQPIYELSDELKKVKKEKEIEVKVKDAMIKSIESTAELKNLSILSLNHNQHHHFKRKQRKRRKKQQEETGATKLVCSSGSLDDNTSQTTHVNDNTGTLDPLIRRANSALNLLKALNSSSNPSINDDDDDDDNEGDAEVDEQSLLSPSSINESRMMMTMMVTSTPPTTTTTTTTATNNTLTTRQSRDNKPLTSPSNSCSSNSTGYNSDTRSTTNPTRTATPSDIVSNTGTQKNITNNKY